MAITDTKRVLEILTRMNRLKNHVALLRKYWRVIPSDHETSNAIMDRIVSIRGGTENDPRFKKAPHRAATKG